VNRRIAAALSSLVLVAGVAAACGGDGGGPGAAGGGSGGGGGMIARLNMGDFGGGNAPQRNFNPFLVATKLTTEYTFEPLFMTNRYSCEITPWLGTSYE
jgi:peptide/nickel transport system substrate-binding protein